MAKKTGISSYPSKSSAHRTRVERYLSTLEKLYEQAHREFASLASKADYDNDEQFFFENYPALNKEAKKVVNKLALGIEQVIQRGTTAEWAKANEGSSELINSILANAGIKDTGELSDDAMHQYFNNNDDALKAFQKRREAGIKLSQKVWNYAEQERLESQLAISISEGTDADTLAESIEKYLVDPTGLFRRVRDQYGILRMSKNAKAFHPGAGVYRSSFQNAKRLARNEINIAYKSAESERWDDIDFVVGIEIKRSTHDYECDDVCERLKGKYPKDFKFTGWHPNCRCFQIPILCTRDEMRKRRQAIIKGEPVDFHSVNEVTDVPDNFKEWCRDNESRISAARERGTVPYFIQDNEQYVAGSVEIVASSRPVNGVDMYSGLNALPAESEYKNATLQHYYGKQQGFDGLPSVVDKFDDDDIIVYRGVQGKDKAQSETYANDFKYGELFAGKGAFGDGTYVAIDKSVADGYAGSVGEVLTIGIPKGMRFITHAELVELRKTYNKELHEIGMKFLKGDKSISVDMLEARERVLNDDGAFATILGYDGIYSEEWKYYTIFNRTKLKVLR